MNRSKLHKNRPLKLAKQIATAILVCSIARSTHALDIFGRDASQGGHGSREGLVGLYMFNPTRGDSTIPANQVADESGVGTPLDLSISNTASIQRKCNRSYYDPVTRQQVPVCFLDFMDGSKNVVKSMAPATKISSACKTSNELTVELWVRNKRNDDLTIEGRMMPLKIISLGRNTTQAATANTKFLGSSNDNNFYLGLDYKDAAQVTVSARQGARTQRNATAQDGFTNPDNQTNMTEAAKYAIETSRLTLNTPDNADTKILEKEKLQHIIATYAANGDGLLYVSSTSLGDIENEDPFSIQPVPRTPVVSGLVKDRPFSGWNDQFYLSLGNEATYDAANAPVVHSGNTTFRTENREWRGEIYLAAVYCKAHSQKVILGDSAPESANKIYPPNPSVTVTKDHELAALIYSRVTGSKIPVTAPIISGVNDPRVPDEDYAGRGMVQLIQQNKIYEAAKLAATQDDFYNITVRDFAKRMSTRDESVNTQLNDMVATIIGLVRDQRPATEILTGNYFYMGDPKTTATPSNIQNDLLISNNHYERLEALRYNLRKVLVRVNGQKISTGTAPVDHPEPSGVLTSRAFLAAHAIAGTNRRIIEYAFREFMCIPMTGWADSTGPDNSIGRDVDRYPGGDHTKFLNTCRSCHSNMDGLRGAFAKIHFNNNLVKHADVITSLATTEANETATTMCQRPNGVACKMNRNDDVFPGDIIADDNSWINNANRNSNAVMFGWNQTVEGYGIKSFGRMLSESKAFPNCMAKRAYRAVCKREPAAIDQPMIDRVASEFKADNYNMANLFSRIVVTKECLGTEVSP